MSCDISLHAEPKKYLMGAAFLLSCILATSAAGLPLACPKADKSFNSFLLRFTDDAPFQASRIIIPLVSRFGDEKLSSHTVELWTSSDISQQKNPLIYSSSELKKQFLVQSVLLLQPHRYAEVTQENAGEADSTRLLYKFRNVAGCWFLEEVHDRSL